jgi:amidase
MSLDLPFQTAKQLAAAVRKKKIGCLELLDLYLKRVEAHNPKLNAIIATDVEAARKRAKAADKALKAGKTLGPLHGVPMTIKESFDVAGYPTTWGDPTFKDTIVEQNSLVAQRMIDAGVTLFGKTNVPLNLADWQSYNAVYGVTCNPWNAGRTPGGSSGGAAAALAAGYVPLELGSDIGGSLRVPASFCGVFAHKPTYGIVPTRGSAPPGAPSLSVPVSVDLAVTGPMARSAGDLALALDVIAGPDDADALAYKLALPPPRHTDLRDFRVLVVDEHPLLPTSGSVRAALDSIAGRLAKSGVKVERTSPLLPDLALAGRVYTGLLMAVFGADYPDDVYKRLQSAAAELPSDAMSLAAIGLRGNVMSHREWIRTDRIRTGVDDRWRRFFREWDVVLCPVMPTPAFAHDHSDMAARLISIDGSQVRYGDQTMWSSIATLAGLPSTAMPIGLSGEGLPIGMQIIGPYLEDRTTIVFAGLVEREFGGFIAPPAFRS